jgi:hypothetical protein
MFNTSVSSTNKNLLYSYLLTGSAPNITINNFTSFVDDTTYGSSGKLNISANATMSSYANVLMIYVFDTKSAQVGYTTYPLTISIVQNPT